MEPTPTFAEWFEEYRLGFVGASGTGRSNAIAALALGAGVSHMAVRRALAGTAVRPETARALAEYAITVTPSALIFATEPLVMAPRAPRDDAKPGRAA